MNPLRLLAIWLGKLTHLALRITGSTGGTWPGEVTLRIYPSILRFFSQQDITIILIAGTNGKTTTSKMVETILRAAGKRVTRNDSGANLDNGLVSTFLKDAGVTGKLRSQYFIFEVDEASVSVVLSHLTPNVIVLLNLFRDQLDRYGEVDAIADKWSQALSGVPSKLLVNGDDPHLAYIASKLKAPVSYFGLGSSQYYKAKVEHATDAIYCPNCGKRMTFGGTYFSHLGTWTCGHCRFTHPGLDITAKDVISPLPGVYNIYNSLASALVARELGISESDAQEALGTFTPAFGRMETIQAGGKNITILLSKNPTGFNESLRTALAGGAKNIVFFLNDRIPDGRDVSWIWDVDFDVLDQKQEYVVSGDRAYDLALRLKYEGKKARVETDVQDALFTSLSNVKDGETLWVLPTYSAMLEVRQVLTGKKIL